MHKRRYSLLFGIMIVFILTLAAACGGDDDGTDATPGPDETGTAVAGRTGAPAATQSPDGGGEPAGNGTPANGDSPSGGGGGDDDDDSSASQAAQRAIQRLDGALDEMESAVETLGRRLPEAPGSSDDEEEHWFERCCDGPVEDLEEALRDANRAVQSLVEAYAEEGETGLLQIAEGLATHTANIEAWMTVLMSQPTSEGAATIVDDMTEEVAALANARSGLQ